MVSVSVCICPYGAASWLAHGVSVFVGKCMRMCACVYVHVYDLCVCVCVCLDVYVCLPAHH